MFIYFSLPFFMSLSTLSSYSWREGLWHKDFVSLTVVTLSFLFSGIYFYYKGKEKVSSLHILNLFILIVGGIYSLIWIWKVFHAVLTPEYLARMMTLLAYTIIGLIAYAKGEHENRKVLYRFGMGILILVVARLLTVEVWAMELTMRILTFFIVGLLFIGSVLLKKSREQPMQKV